jgi:hypothetical protein
VAPQLLQKRPRSAGAPHVEHRRTAMAVPHSAQKRAASSTSAEQVGHLRMAEP